MTNAHIADVDALGSTLTERFQNKGIETYDDFTTYKARTRGVWYNHIKGVGELTARNVEEEWRSNAGY